MAKASNATKQIDSPNLRPHTADLNRLIAGEHHDRGLLDRPWRAHTLACGHPHAEFLESSQ